MPCLRRTSQKNVLRIAITGPGTKGDRGVARKECLESRDSDRVSSEANGQCTCGSTSLEHYLEILNEFQRIVEAGANQTELNS